MGLPRTLIPSAQYDIMAKNATVTYIRNSRGHSPRAQPDPTPGSHTWQG